MTAVREIAVVIPVRDEEELLPRCLASVRVAERALPLRAAHIRIVTVLDRCTDGCLEIAVEGGADPVFSTAGNVGAARRTGVEHALARASTTDLREIWIATTDADSCVPPSWLAEQFGLAALGYDLAVGSVRPDADDLTAEELEAWKGQHRFDADHRHVFGANLGIRASAYRAAGGFAALRSGEDVALVEAVRATGARERRGHGTPVVTSGRHIGRAPDGFAAYLASMKVAPQAPTSQVVA